MSFCLYVAARVFIQYTKSRPEDQQAQTSLQFLLTAMHSMKSRNPLNESFLMQLEVDLDGTGLQQSPPVYTSTPCRAIVRILFALCLLREYIINR